MSATISVLFDGYSRIDASKNIMHANCTCTLIKSKGLNVIVDSMTPWDKEKLVEALAKDHKIEPSEINYVVSTHGHSDHLGNNNLFLNAVHIVGQSVSKHDEYYLDAFKDGSFVITDEVQVFTTPGHTLDSVSVKVCTPNGIVVVAGDLFECQQDLNDEAIWKNAGSEDVEKQKANRKMCLEMADFIIPGHGKMC